MVEIDQRQLDADEFLLNTPSATYDLRIGIASAHEHTPADYITKQTSVDPADKGTEIWQDALITFFCGDNELISYVQEVAGLSAIGKVCVEALIIAYGEGRNGKSTFWNTLARVLGTYSGNLSADTLTVGCKRNVKPELAEAKGKRLIIAAELEEGMRLSTANVKQLSSTDEIYAEKKVQGPVQLRAEPHSRTLHEPPAEGRCARCRNVAQADRDPIQCEDRRPRRISRTMLIISMRKPVAQFSNGSWLVPSV